MYFASETNRNKAKTWLAASRNSVFFGDGFWLKKKRTKKNAAGAPGKSLIGSVKSTQCPSDKDRLPDDKKEALKIEECF